MNVFVLELAQKDLSNPMDNHSANIKIEDNIGESIHLHYINTRQEFTVADFKKFVDGVEIALEAGNGN